MKKLLLAFSMLSLIACNNKQKEETTIETEVVPEVVGETIKEEETIAQSEVTVNWYAYKLEEKVPVKGTFTDIKVDYNKEGKNLEEKLSQSTFKINKESSNTDDPERDKTITDNFFNNLLGDIHGKVGELNDGTAEVAITMNDKTVNKTFTYIIEGDTIHFKGELDILKDFMADTAFNALHEACSLLHNGKTWTEVAVEVSVSL